MPLTHTLPLATSQTGYFIKGVALVASVLLWLIWGLLTSGSKQNNQQRRDSNLGPHCSKPPLCHVSQIIVLSCFYSHSLFTSLGRYFFEHFFLKTVLFSTKQKLPYLYFSGAQSVPSLNQCRGIKLGIGNKV